MKKLGIIGGLGPMATAYFLQLIVEMTKAGTDQEHIEIVLYHSPQIPDRTAYILGKSKENPLPYFSSIAEKLQKEGAEVLAVPCMSAHYFYEDLQNSIEMPVINAVEETAQYLKSHNYSKVGIMATDASIEKGIFSKAFEKYEIGSIVPEQQQQSMVMELIYDYIKAGKEIPWDYLEQIGESLFAKGAEVILLGCTELSLLKKEKKQMHGYLDVLEVLARRCVELCGSLKIKFEKLQV